MNRASDREALQEVLRWWAILPRSDGLFRLLSSGLESTIREVEASASLFWGFDGLRLRLLTAHRTSIDLFKPGKMNIGEGLSGRAMMERKPLASENLETDDRLALRESGYTRVFRSLIAIPLTLGQEPCGVINVLDKKLRRFTEKDVSALQFLTQRLALSLHHCAFFPELAGDWLMQLQFDTRTLKVNKRDSTGDTQLPKGISYPTLTAICSALGAASGYTTSGELTKTTGLSHTTLRHYLSYMAETGMAVRSPSYGQIGRPQYRYKLDNERVSDGR